MFLQGHNPGNDSDYSAGNAAVVHILDLELQFSWHPKTIVSISVLKFSRGSGLILLYPNAFTGRIIPSWVSCRITNPFLPITLILSFKKTSKYLKKFLMQNTLVSLLNNYHMPLFP